MLTMIFEINIKNDSKSGLFSQGKSKGRQKFINIITECIMGSGLFRLIDIHCN